MEGSSSHARGRWHESGLESRLGPSLFCVGRLLERRLFRALAEAGLGLTPAQARVLVSLHFHAPLTQQELANHLDVEPSTLVGTLDVLEREGLALRDRNPSDRRAYLVSTTEKGEALVPGLFALWDGIEKELERALPPEDRSRFLASLNLLMEKLWEGEESC